MSVTVIFNIKGNDIPLKYGVHIVDLTTGLNLAFGIVCALYRRNFTNKGELV